MDAPLQCRFLSGTACLFSTRSPEKASGNADGNEDCAAMDCAAIIPFDEQSGVLVVADGMGGHAAGEVAARYAVESLATAIQSGRDSGSPLRSAIIDGFELANERVQQFAKGAGTTLAVAEISGQLVRPYHCGDSIILVTGQRGKLKLVTTSHSPIGYGVEAGLLDAQAAMHHEDRHLVLNAVGNTEMRIEIGSAIRLAPRDTLVVASDGLTDNLHVADIVQVMRKGNLHQSLTGLVRSCQDRMRGDSEYPCKPDDLTIIAFRLK
jgi:serine/threonine protein phosphatase PrpC